MNLTSTDLSREEIIELVQAVVPEVVSYYEERMNKMALRIDYSKEQTEVASRFLAPCIDMLNLEYWARVANTLATSTLSDIYNRCMTLAIELSFLLTELDEFENENKIEIAAMTLPETKEAIVNGR